MTEDTYSPRRRRPPHHRIITYSSNYLVVASTCALFKTLRHDEDIVDVQFTLKTGDYEPSYITFYIGRKDSK
jgi:hypothetical protein